MALKTYLHLTNFPGDAKDNPAYQGWIEISRWQLVSGANGGLEITVRSPAVAAGLEAARILNVTFSNGEIRGVDDEHVMFIIQQHDLRVTSVNQTGDGGEISFSVGDSLASHGSVPHENGNRIARQQRTASAARV